MTDDTMPKLFNKLTTRQFGVHLQIRQHRPHS